MTLDEIIQTLEKVRADSPLGGGTVVTLCRVGSGVSNAAVEKVRLETDKDGALVEVLGTFEDDASAADDPKDEALRECRAMLKDLLAAVGHTTTRELHRDPKGLIETVDALVGESE